MYDNGIQATGLERKTFPPRYVCVGRFNATAGDIEPVSVGIYLAEFKTRTGNGGKSFNDNGYCLRADYIC